MKNDIRALMVFDWNGTLLDDTEAIIYADNCALVHFGGRPISPKQYSDTVMIPKLKFYMLHGCSSEVVEKNTGAIADFAAAHYQKKLPSCKLREGAIEALKLLKTFNVHVLILSNDMAENIQIQLKKFGIDVYIDAVLANTDPHAFMKSAFKQDRLADYLAKTGPYHPQVIVGDSTEEIIIGKNLGLTTVSLLMGTHSRERLASGSPDLLIPGLVEASGFLQHIFGRDTQHQSEPRNG